MYKPRKPMKALLVLSRVALASAALVVSACAHDVSSPTSSTLTPRDANKALVGAIDGIYTYTVDPTQSNTLSFGKSYLTIPANSVCDLGSSGYGASYWNSSCTAATTTFTVSAIVRGAQTTNPSIEFQPALRFSPATSTLLYIYVTDAATLSNMTKMKYCSGDLLSSCVDESLTDPSLQTTIDASAGLVWRRIKHFSGYLIAE